MDWFTQALALYLAIDVVCFAVCWGVLRSVRSFTLRRNLIAFVLAWLSLPIVTILLGVSPSQFMDAGIWWAAIIVNAVFLYAFGRVPARS